MTGNKSFKIVITYEDYRINDFYQKQTEYYNKYRESRGGENHVKKQYDVLVVGGGAAGMAAAIGAAKTGASCLLVERYGCLGGQATTANVLSYCGFFTHGENAQQIVKGVGQEILEELHALGQYDGYTLSPVGMPLWHWTRRLQNLLWIRLFLVIQ